MTDTEIIVVGSVGEWAELVAVIVALLVILYSWVTFVFGSPELRTIKSEMNGLRELLGELIAKL